jgi:hypothetical protein
MTSQVTVVEPHVRQPDEPFPFLKRSIHLLHIGNSFSIYEVDIHILQPPTALLEFDTTEARGWPCCAR